MSWRNERMENTVHAHEREEARDAARFATGPCWKHAFHSDGRGGGACECGETLSREELS